MRPEAINVEGRLYRDKHGFEHPVTHWFDENGADCDPEEATVCVAGSEGRWFAIRLSDFEDNQQ